MTWQRAGLAAAVAVALTLVETAPHAATMLIAFLAFHVSSRALAGRPVLSDGAPITLQTGVPAAAVLMGFALVQSWPHAATLGIGFAILWAICARLDTSS